MVHIIRIYNDTLYLPIEIFLIRKFIEFGSQILAKYKAQTYILFCLIKKT